MVRIGIDEHKKNFFVIGGWGCVHGDGGGEPLGGEEEEERK